METKVRDFNEIKIVQFYGKMDSTTSSEAQCLLSGLMKKGGEKILINFESLDYISSAGLRVLLATAKQLKNSGGSLRICNPNETVLKVFTISGFSQMINVYTSESEAMIGF
jgi:anti-sigma B factor antagonist